MPRKRRVTLSDIAREAGVSPAAVSAALNAPRAAVSLSDETRDRIRRLARQMGYDRGHLRSRRGFADTVAIFAPGGQSPNDPVHYPLLVSTCEVLARQDTRVMLETSDATVPHENVAERLRRIRADGVIVIGLLRFIDELSRLAIPYVHIGEVPEGASVCRVHVDNELGGRLVAEHLWSLGHRDVAVLQLEFGTCAEKRVAGLRSGWLEHGAMIPDERVYNFSYPFEEKLPGILRDVIARPQGNGKRPTALFCNADWVASHVMRELSGMGLRVPRDVSVVGFDDAHYASLLSPPLTTVRQPFAEIGALAVQLLHELLGPNKPRDKAYVLPCQLVARGSTAPPTEAMAVSMPR